MPGNVDLKVFPYNESYLQIGCEEGIARELSEYFTFVVPNSQFDVRVRNGWWDGKIRLFSLNNGTLYRGLLYKVKEFTKSRKYSINVDDSLESTEEFSVDEAKEFIGTLNLPYEVRDYQLEAFIKSVRYRRRLWLAPTASGKSLIAYLLVRYLQPKYLHGLIIVPTTNLVEQMFSDFKEYSIKNKWPVEEHIQKIYSGQDKNLTHDVVISTWQSLVKFDEEWFQNIQYTIGDEAHLYQAKSLKYIMENLVDSEYRIGMTGSLDKTNTHQLVLEGLFGRVKRVAETKKLIERKQLSQFKIKSLVLKYPDHIRQTYGDLEYQKELAFLLAHEPRNRFLANLALSLEGNTFVMYDRVEKHGKILYDLIKEKAKGKKVYFIHGEVKPEEREKWRKLANKSTNSIFVSSYKTFAMGVNFPNLHNMIFASPFKSMIRNLQSIGRTLRLGDLKEEAILFDIADDLRYGSNINYAIDHFLERTKLYRSEGFPFRIYNIQMKGE